MGLLTETKIARIKVTGSPQVKTDGEGLYLRISAIGYKSWAFLYTDDEGKRRWHRLGGYTEKNNLEAARKKRNDVIGLLEKELDPNGERERRKEKRLNSPTVPQYVEDFLETYAKENRKSWQEDKRILEKEVVPKWRNRKLKDISAGDVSRLYKGIGNVPRGKKVLANRTRAILHLMFSLAIEEELVENNPVAAVRRRYKEPNRKRFLKKEEISTLWHSLDDDTLPVGTEVKKSLKFILATACRPGEDTCLTWEMIESGEEWWNLPAEYSKSGLDQRIYLNSMAREIIGERPEGGGPVFKTRLKRGGPITVRAISKAVRRCGYFGLQTFTPHDMRRTTSTNLGKLKYTDFIIGVILTHKRRGVTPIYNQHEYDDEKREAMDQWDVELREILDEKFELDSDESSPPGDLQS